MNIQDIMKDIKNTDKNIIKIMKKGVEFSFAFCLIACLILFTYILSSNVSVFYIGVSLFKSGLFFLVGFVICGIAFNSIMKEL